LRHAGIRVASSACGAKRSAGSQGRIESWKQARVIGADTTFGPIPGTESVVDTRTEDLHERVLEPSAGREVDVVFDTVGGLDIRAGIAILKPPVIEIVPFEPWMPTVG
jgi:NADPH:quinone reductase-like Zn-dependent oxidoreductase